MNLQASTSGQRIEESRKNVERFEDLASKISKRSAVFINEEETEANLIRALGPLLTAKLSDFEKKSILAVWLNVLGLCPVNIRHLELCSILDVQALINTPHRELRSFCDRGRFSAEVKQRLLKSTNLVIKFLHAVQAGTENSLLNRELSWTFGSPTVEKRSVLEERKSSSMSPPTERIGSLRRRQGATSVDLDEKPVENKPPSLSTSSLSPNPNLDLSLSSLSGRTSTDSSSARCGSLSHLSTSSSTSGMHSICSSTLSPPSPLSTSTQSTPSLGVGSKVIMSTSMQFGTPKSPKTSRLVHSIPHKWHRSTKFRFASDAVCHFCQRPLGFGFLNAWEKCRSCKWKVHTQCKGRVGDSCGLTPDHLRFLFNKLIEENNGGMWNDPQSAAPLPGSRSMHEPAFQYPDTAIDSSSSTNSSAPSTPALQLGLSSSPYNSLTAPYRSDRKFLFPDAAAEPPSNLPILVISEGEQTNKEEGESRGIGEGSEGTITVDSTEGNAENGEQPTRAMDGLPAGHTWDRHTWNMSTIRGPNAQSSWNEITIPYRNIELTGLIGTGRFGEVYSGFHFGDVAVKMLTMQHIEKEKRLDEFKAEVSAHKNTRHDNIVLFLGFCMEGDTFGIVMSPCKGKSLHYLLHEKKERIELSAVLSISQQICQGVSYLHTKKILHKDLRSKNIFVESKHKVVITDFGLLSMKRLKVPERDDGILLPTNWLCYAAPELVRVISFDCEQLPFTEQTDVFAFGSVWYEMLTGRVPFGNEPWQKLVWMVGNGLKASIHNLNCNKDMKEVMMRCWNRKPEDRPSFVDIQALLVALPKKRLDRSPSFPQIRSFESAF